MKIPFLSLFILAACTLSALAQRPSPASGVSPSGGITWSVDPGNGDLNLVRANGQGALVKLCDTISTANLGVHFSPDEKYVMVTDGSASVGIHVTLYKRSSGLSYRKVNFDFDLAVQRLAMEVETGRKIDDTVLDRSYLKCLGWSRDGQWAVLHLSGSGKLDGKRVEIGGFQCAYNPAQGGITNDQRVMR